jgi:osmoprotectant transport system ATP-binding protein
VRDLHKRYGSRAAVDGLSFTVEPGRVTGFVGPNGAGKSTTMRVILGLDHADEGTALVGGRAYRTLRTPLREVGALLDASAVHPGRSAYDHLLWMAHANGLPSRRVDELIELVGLEQGMADRYPSQLSGGQQQRVGVARALAADPPVLLMDEPFGAVDPIVRSQLQREFAKLQRDLGKTVVFVTHDVDEAIVLGDRIAVLETGGRLAQLAAPAELLAHPASAFVADFLGGRTVEYEDGKPVGYRIEARFEPGDPKPDAAIHEDAPDVGAAT